jgi:hypothetical protein
VRTWCHFVQLWHTGSASHRDFFNGNGAVQGISVATV